MQEGYLRVKLIPPSADFKSALVNRADENGYVVLSEEEYTELLDPLFARTR